MSRASRTNTNCRETICFCKNWRFARYGRMPDGCFVAEPDGLENPSARDADWRVINVPHDWGIEGPFRADLPNRTGKLPWAGIGWYRKHFDIPLADQGKRIFIDFDGAMSCATVWLNGVLIGTWSYGYSSFRFDLTEHIRFGETNTIAVRLDNPEDSSRWYPGGGIYRNVYLTKTESLHVAHWGTFAYPEEIYGNHATLKIHTAVHNQRTQRTHVALRHSIVSKNDPSLILHEITAFDDLIDPDIEKSIECRLAMHDIRRWDIKTPHLYTLVTELFSDGTLVDSYQTVFGLRTIEFNAQEGFLLNGQPVRLNGVCLHHDLGPLGTAVNTRAIERQLEIMKDMGCNAVRSTHNPPAPEFLDLCDQMGILVIDEAFDCWAVAKTTNDYSRLFEEWHEKDLVAMIRRDRNHPSIILWSTGNEMQEQQDEHLNTILSSRLTDIVRREDPTRPVTVGCNNPEAGFNGFAETVDVFGYNYKPHLYQKFHKTHPDIPLYGSETSSCISSRGEYFFPLSSDKEKGEGGFFQVSGYDIYAPVWGCSPDEEFAFQDNNPCVFGEFVWTGFDYLGEPTPYNQDKTNLLNASDPVVRAKIEKQLEKLGGRIPPRSSYFGIVDLCGIKKDRFYLYQARWRPDHPMAHLLPHWNWDERQGLVTPVHLYTSGDEAELFLNGISCGRKTKKPGQYRLCWEDITYQPGVLHAIAYKNGKHWAESIRKTSGPARQIHLSADRNIVRADGLDLSFVTAFICDAEGTPVPRADNKIYFDIDGPGEIIAVCNGNAVSHEPFQAKNIQSFNGACIVIIRSLQNISGQINLSASADDLSTAITTIQATTADRKMTPDRFESNVDRQGHTIRQLTTF